MQIGSKLMCIARTDNKRYGWIEEKTGKNVKGPVYKEIVTFDGVVPDSTSSIFLKEYPAEEGWQSKWFVPLDEDTQFDEAIESLVNPKVEELV